MKTALIALVFAAFVVLAGCGREQPVAVPAQPATKPATKQAEEGFSRKGAKTLELGTFEVASDRIVASDPCYPIEEKDLSCVASPTRRGSWQATVIRIDAGGWGPRNAELIARHPAATGAPSWRQQPGALSVDSGQLGIFDRARYRDDQLVAKDYRWKDKPIDPTQPWYSLCCEKTLSEVGAGVVPFGVVSSSGVGDGAYDWFLWIEQGKVVGIRILFLPE